MQNPFENLGQELEYEEITGCSLSCQYPGCFRVEHEGRYITKDKLLTWKCKDGHVSYLKDFNL